MEKPITLTVTSAQTRAEIRDTITAGDSSAYPLSITFSDLTAITGTVRFRFVRGDAYWDRDATVDGNTVSLMLEPDFYSAPGAELWVSFEDSNLYTPLHVYFRDIRVPSGNVAAATSQPYPAWAEDMIDYDITVGTVTTLAEGESATASITGDVPDKVLNLGIPQGATGAQGPQGDKGDPNTLSIGSVDTLAPAEPATATITGTSPNQTLSLGIPKGDKGDTGDAATVAVGTVSTLAAGESATVGNSGTTGAAVLDFGIPRGDKGDTGEMTIGTVTTLAPGESATVENVGTSTDAVLNIGIPAGYDGSAVPIDDASEAADRVLSAQYIKGQLAQMENKNHTNIITNGDFSDGTTGWSFVLGGGTVVNGVLNFLATAQYGQARQLFSAPAVETIVQAAVSVKSSSVNATIEIFKQSDGALLGTAAHSGSGTFETLFCRGTVPSGVAYGIRIIDRNTSGWATIYADDAVAVNITTTYGAGSEPTESEIWNNIQRSNSNELYFNGTISVATWKEQASILPIYCFIVDDIVRVVAKYSSAYDLMVELKKRGPNLLHEFSKFVLVPNTSSIVSSKTTGTLLLASGTDWFAPYGVKAVNNIDGDLPASAHFTGGNHGYNNDSTGSATARNVSLAIRVDGRPVTSFSGYCSFIDIVRVNRIQATNTKVSAGGGREVIEETIHMHFDGFKWTTKVEIEFLEQCLMSKYYGLQAVTTAWNTSIFYHSCSNRVWNNAATNTNSTSKTCNRMTLKKGIHRLDVDVDITTGIGNHAMNLLTAHSAFVESSKAYFNLINVSDMTIASGNTYSYIGGYRFYAIE